jgi:hypothetical protein
MGKRRRVPARWLLSRHTVTHTRQRMSHPHILHTRAADTRSHNTPSHVLPSPCRPTYVHPHTRTLPIVSMPHTHKEHTLLRARSGPPHHCLPPMGRRRRQTAQWEKRRGHTLHTQRVGADTRNSDTHRPHGAATSSNATRVSLPQSHHTHVLAHTQKHHTIHTHTHQHTHAHAPTIKGPNTFKVGPKSAHTDN